MRRRIIAAVAIAFLLTAAALRLWAPQSAGDQAIQAGCWRVGVLMAVLWVAYPDAVRMPVWLWGAIPALAIILAVRPKWFLIALPLVILILLIRPRKSKQP